MNSGLLYFVCEAVVISAQFPTSECVQLPETIYHIVLVYCKEKSIKPKTVVYFSGFICCWNYVSQVNKATSKLNSLLLIWLINLVLRMILLHARELTLVRQYALVKWSQTKYPVRKFLLHDHRQSI